jgi:hypothetical protein
MDLKTNGEKGKASNGHDSTQQQLLPPKEIEEVKAILVRSVNE